MNTDSELAFFCLLVKRGSLAATARELNLTPPAVSRRLAQLEERLGVRLLNRTTRRISLTGEGEVYFNEAQRILGDIEELERRLASNRAAPKGLLRVNAPLGFGRSYIGPAISLFTRQYPEVEVQLHLTDRPINLPDEAIDVSIRFGEIPDSRLVARKIAVNRRLLCAAPGGRSIRRNLASTSASCCARTKPPTATGAFRTASRRKRSRCMAISAPTTARWR